MNYSCCNINIDYQLFINDYNLKEIDSLKVQRKKKKSYLNSMILLHLFFFCLNIINFKWMFFLTYLTFYLLCFLFCNQYAFYIKFSYKNEIKKLNIHPKEHELFVELENKLHSNKSIPTKFKNESFIKSYI